MRESGACVLFRCVLFQVIAMMRCEPLQDDARQSRPLEFCAIDGTCTKFKKPRNGFRGVTDDAAAMAAMRKSITAGPKFRRRAPICAQMYGHGARNCSRDRECHRAKDAPADTAQEKIRPSRSRVIARSIFGRWCTFVGIETVAHRRLRVVFAS